MTQAPAFYDAEAVERLVDYPGCIAAMRSAMVALSNTSRPQPLRQIAPVGEGGLFAAMPGELAALSTFGAKLVSVFEDVPGSGRTRHRGLVVGFDGATGAVNCIADAEAVTTIRTACATAAATVALARPDARIAAVFGTGTQARSHLRALHVAHPFERLLLWGRSFDTAAEVARELGNELGITIEPVADARDAAARADVICTVTGSKQPVVLNEWVRAGTHVNLVGSSYLGPVEVDTALVARSRYVADYRPSALAQASELAVARDAGAVDDSHVVGEIGQVFAGAIPGRQDTDQVTLYKSLGHVVQDLAAVAYLHLQADKDIPR